MVDNYVRVQPDSTGKKLQTYENTIGANDVHAEAVTLVSSDGKPVIVDAADNSFCVIDFVHHKIHNGTHYGAQVYDVDTDIAAPKYVRITAPNTPARIHLTFQVSSDGEFLLEFYENPTLLAAGAAVTAYNNDRNSGNSATATVFQDTTVQAPLNDGTLLPWGGFSGTAKKKTSSDSEERKEIILKQDEDYLIKITVAADDTVLNIKLSWYEV